MVRKVLVGCCSEGFMGERCRVSEVCWGGEVVVEMTVVGRREKRERRVSLMQAEIGRILQIRGQSILFNFYLSTVRTVT